MKYTKVEFTITPRSTDACDVLASMLAEADFESFEDTDKGIDGYVQSDSYDKEKIDNVIGNFPIRNISITYDSEDVPDEDWNETWESAGFAPIHIGNRCVIYDAHGSGKDSVGNDGTPLRIGIEARQAFGTGVHETTQMIVATLLDMDIKGKSVLDCGCGTGILGIVAAKCGAKNVVAYDIDDWSVRNARHNAELNNVEIEVLEGDKSVLSHVNGVFDIVLANINRNILVNDMEAFTEVMSSGSILVLSGFYNDDADILLEKGMQLGLTEVSRKTQNKWCCLVLGYKLQD